MRRPQHIFLALCLALLPFAAHAQQLINPLGTADLRSIIGRIIGAALGFSGVLALAMFVWGGIQWMTSAGSPDAVKKAKATLSSAAIGLVIIFTSYTLVSAVITAITSGTVK